MDTMYTMNWALNWQCWLVHVHAQDLELKQRW